MILYKKFVVSWSYSGYHWVFNIIGWSMSCGILIAITIRCGGRIRILKITYNTPNPPQ